MNKKLVPPKEVILKILVILCLLLLLNHSIVEGKIHKKMKVKVSFYSEKHNKTSNGSIPVPNQTVAVSRNLYKKLKGRKIHIEGIGTRKVEDKMKAKHGNKIDIFVDNKYKAKKLGIKKNVTITILD